MPDKNLYLGVDGGQSHTEAVVADAQGHILGRGLGGPSNHAELPAGRERLRLAVHDSVGSALRSATPSYTNDTEFAAAHFAMTGEATFKEEVVRTVVKARHFTLGHDAPAALAGATGGKPGVVVVAGTGTVTYGENRLGESLRLGGWGYLFGDQGGAFWTAAEGIRRALQAHDKLGTPTALGALALRYFHVADFFLLTQSFYNEQLSRQRLAGFSVSVHDAAVAGDRVAIDIIREGCEALSAAAAAVATSLKLSAAETCVSHAGGMFNGSLVRKMFAEALSRRLPDASIVRPRFGPAIGALLLAYHSAQCPVTDEMLANLEKGMLEGRDRIAVRGVAP